MSLTVERLVRNFESLNDWEERYRYLVELGRKLPKLPEEFKTEENRVKGCTSRAWFVLKQGPEGRLSFLAESDASIVQGLVAVLLAVYSGKLPAEIASVDIREVFRRLGLERNLSPNRRDGFFAMVEKIRKLSGANGS